MAKAMKDLLDENLTDKMEKIRGLFLLVFVTLLIGVVSAQISISPSTINLGNVYPGETYPINLTITTDTPQVLQFNSTNQFTITPNEVLVNNGDNITINITIASDAPAGDLSFDLMPYVQVEQVQVPVPSPSSPPIIQFGGTRTIYQNNTVYVPNNETTNNQNSSLTSTNSSSDILAGIIVLTIGVVLFIIGLILFILSKKNTNERRFENYGNTNTNNNEEEVQ